MTLLALKLVLAHFIGDFVFQPTRWVEDKLRKKWKSKYLYWHIGIHLVALLVLLQFKQLVVVTIVIATHYCIDLGKLVLTNQKNHRWLFVVDQIMHLGIIAVLVYWKEPFQLNLDHLWESESLLLVSCIIFVTYVSGVIIRLLLAPYIEEVAKDDTEEGGSLKNAGKYIGMLERLFIFGFILMGQWAAIGVLIAAKSVFRFGDLNKGKNRKLTEYVLIGTLLSFGLAILAGTLYLGLVETQ